MTNPILNPYNFVPFKGKEKAHKINATRQALTQEGIRHDVLEQHSGEITLSITTQSPLIHGVKQHKVGASDLTPESLLSASGEASWLEPYSRHNCFAISGNSLRGMFGSIAEVISSAAPRVLENKMYAVRQVFSGKNKVIPKTDATGVGIILWDEENKKLSIKPVGILHVLLNHKNKTPNIPEHWQKVFTTSDGELMTYGEVLAIRDKNPGDYVTGIRTCQVENNRLINEQQYFTDVKPGKFYNLTLDENLDLKHPLVDEGKVNRIIQNGKISGNKNGVRLQFVRSTGKSAFGFTGNSQGEFRAKKILLNDDVIEEYIALIIDTEQGELLKPKKGNITQNALHHRVVLFETEPDVEQVSITRVFDSMVWRQAPENGRYTYDFFTDDTLPFSSARDFISPVEALFGVVSADKQSQPKEQVKALASRVRFYDAVSEKGCDLSLLKFLQLPRTGSPKTPCPSMYFNSVENDFIGKLDLNSNPYRPDDSQNSKNPRHRPNGIKRYLRFTPQPLPEEEQSAIHRLWVAPLENTTFSATIGFTNLSKQELALLICAIAPTNNYVHQCGMAKNLGFGQLKAEVKSLSLIDPARYTMQGLLSSNKFAESKSFESIQHWLQDANDWIDPSQCARLAVLNEDQTSSGFKVKFPEDVNQKGETSIFQWFVNNEKNNNQMLPLADNEGIGTLSSK